MPDGCNYSADFMRLWKAFLWCQKQGLGKVGTKPEAWITWMRMDRAGDLPGIDFLLEALRTQAKDKLAERRAGKDPQPFKHVCRWLKYRAWETEEDDPDGSFMEGAEVEVVEESRDRVKSKLQVLTNRDWAK